MQNMLPAKYQHQLDVVREDSAHCIGRFHAVQVLDQNRFSSLQEKLDKLFAMSKGRWLLPKDLLKDLYSFKDHLRISNMLTIQSYSWSGAGISLRYS